MSASKKLGLVALITLLLCTIVAILWFPKRASPSPPVSKIEATKDSPKTATPDKKLVPAPPDETFNRQAYSLDDPTSLWVVVNKARPLPSNYVPAELTAAGVGGGQLRSQAVVALNKLNNGVQLSGLGLKVISAYRSYAAQSSVYNGYVTRDGQAQADTYSARPGYSEHQTGWAVDVGNKNGSCDLQICFGQTALGVWLSNHAAEYGFIIRYPQDQPTGYQYEPWHLRYVGVELAKQLYTNKQTMEMFFGLPVITGYKS